MLFERLHPNAGFRRGYTLTVLLGGLLLLYLVICATGAAVYRVGDPELALRFRSNDAWANANLAFNRIGSVQNRTGARDVESHATLALLRDPLTVRAVSMLGVVAATNNDPAAVRLRFTLASRLSRREPTARLWLIEDAVQRGNVHEALRQYDLALRAFESLRPQLFGVLIPASDDPKIATELNQLLTAKPVWRDEFLLQFSQRSQNPEAMARVTARRLDRNRYEDRNILATLLTRMVALNAPDLAWRLYLSNAPKPTLLSVALRDGTFEGLNNIPPFEWVFAEQVELMPHFERGADGNGNVLELPTGSHGDGLVALQMLHLTAGDYVLQMRTNAASAPEAKRPVAMMSCNAGSANSFLLLPIDGKPMAFRVPKDCPVQWFSLRVNADEGLDNVAQLWVGNLRIVPQ